eukprot:NODE_59_length_28102_cov_0.971110.p26 type:complete len:106 gc:universal NODE_59_length_28102_cov_0.971110:22062-21745(-)
MRLGTLLYLYIKFLIEHPKIRLQKLRELLERPNFIQTRQKSISVPKSIYFCTIWSIRVLRKSIFQGVLMFPRFLFILVVNMYFSELMIPKLLGLTPNSLISHTSH